MQVCVFKAFSRNKMMSMKFKLFEKRCLNFILMSVPLATLLLVRFYRVYMAFSLQKLAIAGC